LRGLFIEDVLILLRGDGAASRTLQCDVTESEFWPRLEYRVCREFAGLRETQLRELWCDGFIARTFFPLGSGTKIVGQVWITAEEQWEFELIVRRRIEAWENVNWDELLPGEDVTGWMSVDLQRKLLKIDPAAAYSDLSEGLKPLPEYRQRK